MSRRLINLASLVLLLLPAAECALRPGEDLLVGLARLLQHASILLVLVGVSAGLHRRSRLARFPVLLAGSAYYTAVWGLFLYWWAWGARLDVLYVWDVRTEVASVVAHSVTPRNIAIASTFLGLVAAIALALSSLSRAYAEWLWSKSSRTRRLRWRAPAVALAIVFIAPAENGLVFGEIGRLVEATQHRQLILPVIPRNAPIRPATRENVFVLQIESANSLALFGKMPVNGEPYEGEYMPELMRIAKRGVLFPEVWASEVTSDRALLSLLCGVSGNIGESLSFSPELIPQTCLANLLAAEGYRTFFYWGFDDPTFTNLHVTLPHIGFDRIRTAEILPGRVLLQDWAVDDCEFYRHAFADLKQTVGDEPERLLVYVKMSSHHWPFRSRPEYDFVNQFPEPKNSVENYLNSFLQQDYCVGKFFELFDAFAGDNSHLFVFADQSWPLGLHGNEHSGIGAWTDSYLVPLVYVPPQSERAASPIVERTRVGFSDFLPTVAELVSHEPRPYSFAPLLKEDGREARPDPSCYLLTQPYDGSFLSVVRGNEKLTYRVSTGEVWQSDLESDLLELNRELVATGVPYSDFRERYLCDRFR